MATSRDGSGVIVTGASAGIGRATVETLAAAGFPVAATMRSPDDAGPLAALPGVTVLPMDVTDPESVKTAVAAAADALGGIEVVVNNAGYAVDGVFEGMSDEVIRQQFEVNVLGLMRVTREVIPHLRRRQRGTIVQVSSMGGRVTFPLYSVYHATKWAVEGFSESLAMELRPLGIRLKLIEPGAIRTDFYGRSRERVRAPADAGYDVFVDRCEAISLSAGTVGAEPKVVATTVLRAITDRGWRLRYPVAAPAPLLTTLRKLLPEGVFLRLIHRRYRITG